MTRWSAYENAVHLSQSDLAFRARLALLAVTASPAATNSPGSYCGRIEKRSQNDQARFHQIRRRDGFGDVCFEASY